MTAVVVSLLHSLRFVARSRASLHLEIVGLRHQRAVLDRARRPRLRLTRLDRMLWAWLSRSWHGWRSAVHIVKGNRHRVAPTRLSSLLDVERSTFGYLLHDRDAVFADVATTIAAMNIRAVRTAPRSTWQNGHVERVIGSIRRECLDHVIALSAAGLQRVLTEYTAYYMTARTHLALAKDSPTPRPIMPPSAGRVVATPLVGGLHHRYDRAAG